MMPIPSVRRTNAQMIKSGIADKIPKPLKTTITAIIIRAIPIVNKTIFVPVFGERLMGDVEVKSVIAVKQTSF
jgi:hypothetical protein